MTSIIDCLQKATVLQKCLKNMSAELKSITHFISQFYNCNLPESICYFTLRDSLSDGQLYSKMQVVKLMLELNIYSNKCLFLAHWHGFLPMLLRNFNLIQIGRGYEKDKSWVEFSNQMNSDWDWKSFHTDILQLDYSRMNGFEDFDLLINTSCEHMNPEWIKQVPEGKKMILQSTDYRHAEHVNSVNSIEEFIGQMPGSFKIIKTDVLCCPIYKRFTVVCVAA